MDSLLLDSLPAFVKEEVFLHLSPSDLVICQMVSSAWRDFVVNNIMQSKAYLTYLEEVATTARRDTIRRVFGNIGPWRSDVEVVVTHTMRVRAACDESERMLYALIKPMDQSSEWTLKQYSCSGDIPWELNAVTLWTSHDIKNMQIVAGHLVLFKQPKEGTCNNNAPAVFSLASIPWAGHLSIESGIPLPGDSFHFSKLLLGRDCLYTVSKDAHVLWKRNERRVRDATHEQFEDPLIRPVVVHRLTKESGEWQEVARLQPKHGFRVMELTKTTNSVPSVERNPKYTNQTCLLHLSNDSINERYLLVSCPLHGSYELFDHVRSLTMWQLDTTKLPFETTRSRLCIAQEDSSHVLAAVRHDYVFIYAEDGVATLVSVRDGTIMRKVNGREFVLSPRYVLPIIFGPNRTFDVSVVDSVSGQTSPTFTFTSNPLATDAFGSRSWHHDDTAYAHFESIARQLLGSGSPAWPRFQLKAEGWWSRYFGHTMLDKSKIVYWSYSSAFSFRIGVGTFHLDEEQVLDIERKLLLSQ